MAGEYGGGESSDRAPSWRLTEPRRLLNGLRGGVELVVLSAGTSQNSKQQGGAFEIVPHPFVLLTFHPFGTNVAPPGAKFFTEAKRSYISHLERFRVILSIMHASLVFLEQALNEESTRLLTEVNIENLYNFIFLKRAEFFDYTVIPRKCSRKDAFRYPNRKGIRVPDYLYQRHVCRRFWQSLDKVILF